MSILQKMMAIAGRGEDGKSKAIKTTNNGELITQDVTKNDVITMFNSIALTDTNSIQSADINIPFKKEWILLVKNTTDAEVRIEIFIKSLSGINLLISSDDLLPKRYIAPTTLDYQMLSVGSKEIDVIGQPLGKISFQIKAETEPTKGSFSLHVAGVR